MEDADEDIDEVLNHSSVDEEEEDDMPDLHLWDEVRPCCEWVNRHIDNFYHRSTCYQTQVFNGRYCYDHKCRGCNNARMTQGEYCVKCPCPVVGCNLTAYACGNRCSCCGEYHRYEGIERDNEEEYGDVMDVWRTCEACVCHVCGKGPIVERYGTWGDVLLCEEHNKCVVVNCDYACDVDNPRYCPKHKHSICKKLRRMELCMLRNHIYKDIRILICKTFRKMIDTYLICRICKCFYKPEADKDICNTCHRIRENGIKDIALESIMGVQIFL